VRSGYRIGKARGTLRLQRCELLECRSNGLQPHSSQAELHNSACGTGCSAQRINEITPAAGVILRIHNVVIIIILSFFIHYSSLILAGARAAPNLRSRATALFALFVCKRFSTRGLCRPARPAGAAPHIGHLGVPAAGVPRECIFGHFSARCTAGGPGIPRKHRAGKDILNESSVRGIYGLLYIFYESPRGDTLCLSPAVLQNWVVLLGS
jgi:hypothetical protein